MTPTIRGLYYGCFHKQMYSRTIFTKILANRNNQQQSYLLHHFLLLYPLLVSLLHDNMNGCLVQSFNIYTVKTEHLNNEIPLIASKLHWSQEKANDNIYISSSVNKNVYPLITEVISGVILAIYLTHQSRYRLQRLLKDRTQSN